MAIQTVGEKNSLAAKYGADAAYAALYTTVPGASPGTEVTGGSPAYARKALTWSAPSNGVITATATFDVPAGVTVAGAGFHTAAAGGTFLDGQTLSQAFASQSPYTVTFTYTQA
jgi:hypothetical protein